ncbi:MAG: Eco57I restriction-modification methylase domain-containing protein, partial [Bradymonadaceae bacterium]
LDPAAGTGAFLREAHRVLREYYEEAGLPEATDDTPADLALRQLYGVDRDDRATDLARLNLAFDAAAHGGDLEVAGDVLAANLTTANALLFERWPDPDSDPSLDLDFADGRPCRWRRAFPEVVADGGFDVVLGNPPWVSYGLRDAGALGDAEKTYLREQFEAAEYKLPLYPLFMELGLRLLRPGGRTSFVVPDSFLVGSRFANIRELLVAQRTLEMVTLLPDGIWADGTSGRTVVYRAARRSGDSGAVTVRTIDGENSEDVADREVGPDQLAAGPGHRIEIFADAAVDRLVDRMRRAETRVADLVELYSGCIARFGQ